MKILLLSTSLNYNNIYCEYFYYVLEMSSRFLITLMLFKISSLKFIYIKGNRSLIFTLAWFQKTAEINPSPSNRSAIADIAIP
jgi:hypothetical protein